MNSDRVERPRCSAQAQQEGISLLEAEKAIEEENKSRPATSEGAIITVEEEFEVRASASSRRRSDAAVTRRSRAGVDPGGQTTC